MATDKTYPSGLRRIGGGTAESVHSEHGSATPDSIETAVQQAIGKGTDALAAIDGLKVTATTLPEGSAATASITGTAPSKTINIGIPRGERGLTEGGDATTFGDRTAIWPLTRALSAGSARIVWMGDSKSEGTNLTSIANRAMDLTRDRLRSRYNLKADTGKGYLPACYRVAAPDLAEEPTRTGDTEEIGYITGAGNRCLKMMPGATVTWPSLTWSANTPVVVHYAQHTATASFEVLVDGTVAKTVNTVGGSIASKTTTVPVSAGAHVISIRVPSGQSAGVFVEGITHRTASTGVAVFDAAVSGGMIRQFTTLPPSATSLASHWSTVAAWQPHLIVAAFGTNEFFWGVTPEVWHDTIKALVAKRDEYAPGAGLLLIHSAQLSSDARTARIDAYEEQARRALASSPRASIIYESHLWKPRPGFNYSSGYGVDPDGWLSDSVHLTAASASAISEHVISTISDAVPAHADFAGYVRTVNGQAPDAAGNIDAAAVQVPDATTAIAGRVELATAAETATGTDAARAVTPAAIKPLLDAKADKSNTYTKAEVDAAVAGGSGGGESVPNASTTTSGKVELATAAEVASGTDATRAVTPATIKPLLDAKANAADVYTKAQTYTKAEVDSAVAAGGGGGSSTNSAVAYAPATTSSNDTSALLAAMNAAKDAGKAFMAPPGKVYTIDPITVPQGLRIDGALCVKGRTPGQSHVLRLSGAAHELTGSSLIIDANGAVDGLQLFNAGRSRFGYVDVRYAARNGVHLMQTNGTVTTPNNNNQTSWQHVVVAQNGTKQTKTATVASQTGTPTAINSGYTTLTLSTALPSWAPDVRVVDSGDETVLSAYLVIIAGKAYRVKGITSTTSIDIYNYPTTSAGTSLTVDVLLGAGFNCPMFRDNQAGLINNLDAISNPAIGLNAGAAYGWSYSKSAYQGCGVGVNVQNFTQGANWIGPYFELNTVDMVIGTNADATITSPQWAEFKLQSLWDRLSSRGEGSHPGLKVIGSTSGGGGRVGPLTANEPPTLNPGTLSLSPGYSYAFQRSVGNPAFRIAPNKNLGLYGANIIDVAIECTGSWSGTVGFTMLTGHDYHPDTVMGGSTYTTPTLSAGSHFFRVFRVGTDWRVTRMSGT